MAEQLQDHTADIPDMEQEGIMRKHVGPNGTAIWLNRRREGVDKMGISIQCRAPGNFEWVTSSSEFSGDRYKEALRDFHELCRHVGDLQTLMKDLDEERRVRVIRGRIVGWVLAAMAAAGIYAVANHQHTNESSRERGRIESTEGGHE